MGCRRTTRLFTVQGTQRGTEGNADRSVRILLNDTNAFLFMVAVITGGHFFFFLSSSVKTLNSGIYKSKQKKMLLFIYLFIYLFCSTGA
jgi:hypothetical protein